jgi:triosephosphate isomerase
MHKKIVANWKMGADAQLAESLLTAYKREVFHCDVNLVVCPSFVHIGLTQAKLKHNREIAFGAQDVSAHTDGAYTGEVSAKTLQELDCKYVIIGHSERRTYHHETTAMVAEKIKRVQEQGLMPIVCIGETLAERQAGQTEKVLWAQLEPILKCFKAQEEFWIAYEPVWAIGTGVAATRDDILQAHAFLREKLYNHRAAVLLYGGSVKPSNALEILGLENVDGALVGGASLNAQDLIAICQAGHRYSQS